MESQHKLAFGITALIVFLFSVLIVSLVADDMYEMRVVKPAIVQHYVWPHSNQ